VYAEEDLIPLSGLQHLLFCARRAALVHIEGLWDDNVFTAEGSLLHHRVEEEPPTESRGGVRIARGLQLRSLTLGLVGKTDVVEFHRLLDTVNGLEPRAPGRKARGIPLNDASGLWQPFPIEYKRGRLRREEGYEIQLCAQAMCLEEMLDVEVPKGALFYGKTRRRLEVNLDDKLRQATEEAARRLHALVNARITPPPVNDERCEACSLASLCLPAVTGSKRRVARYLIGTIEDQCE
jgi:CRISPR-associated exonuclease Cas4